MDRLFLLLALVLFGHGGSAGELVIPAGTTVYAELEQRLTSKKGVHAVGDAARATVWRDVVVDGQTVIERGAPLLVRIKAVKHKRLTDRRGTLVLEALHVKAVDGTKVGLDGGYDSTAKDQVTMASTLSSTIDWSVTFVKGREAVLAPGTIFDAQVKVSTPLSLVDGAHGPSISSDFQAQVLYETMGVKEEQLPVEIRRCGIVVGEPQVVSVNDKSLKEPIPVQVFSSRVNKNCVTYRTRIELKKLGKFFVPGINRFQIQSQDARAEVILDVEL